MPRFGVKYRWCVFALACGVGLGSLGWGRLWWSKNDRRGSPLEQSRAAYKQQDWLTAKTQALEQLKTDRTDPVALRLLGRALYRLKHDQDAAAIFARLTLDTMETEDYLVRGQAAIRARDFERAVDNLKTALQLDPNHFESRVTLEQLFYRTDRLLEADRETERLLVLPGREAAGELLRGQLRFQVSDPAGAAQHFQRALRHPEQWDSVGDPNFFRKQLARSLLRTGQPALARDSLRQLTDDPGDSKTCWLLSRCDLQEAIPVQAAVSAAARSFRESQPMEPEPAPFVGEASCATCHAGIFRDQNKSRHARTYFSKDQFQALKVPAEPIADPYNANVSHAFRKRADSLEVETRVDGQVYQTIVDYAFGSGNRGVTLVGHDQKGEYVEYRLSFYPNHVGWDVTPGQTLKPNQNPALYQGKAISIDDVRHCFECHHTNSHAVLTGTGPASSDRAIGCERCHGPGGNHLKAVTSKGFVANQDADLAIGRPSLASGPAIVRFCAECHSEKKAGRKLTQGEPDAVRFQGTTLTWSRCYTESGEQLDCVTCHNPHRNADSATRWYESRCLQCHSNAGTTVNGVTNSASGTETGGRSSCPVQPASGCIACHMPRKLTPMAHIREFTDHFIRVHRESELQTDKSATR